MSKRGRVKHECRDEHETTTNMTLAEFERLLDVYGGERTRWPVEARASARPSWLRATRGAPGCLPRPRPSIGRSERAPVPSLASEAALADRIVATAQRSPRIVARSRADQADPGAAAARSAGNVVQLAPLRVPGRRWLPRSAFGESRQRSRLRWLWRGLLGLSNLSQQLVAGAGRCHRHLARHNGPCGGASRSAG